MQTRSVKCLVVLACSLAALGMASAYSHNVNYRGQSQEDLTCMQASATVSGQTVVYRNDPSTNCFGFPSLQFDSAPVEGGKPNGMTIDWSLMVDELQMQDDDRVHFHLPGFTGGYNTFGIMGPGIDSAQSGQVYTPNFDSEGSTSDLTSKAAQRADFGALVGIWGISCGTEKNLYMDRAKVDNIRTAEWDPSREMLKFVVKGRRYGPVSGRHDGYTGSRSAEWANADSVTSGVTNSWIATGSLGLAVPFSATNTDPYHDIAVTHATPVLTEATASLITINDQSIRGNQLQAMEYSFEGPRDSTLAWDPSVRGHDLGTSAAGVTMANYKNDGYIYAPGNRVCGIYVDPTKLYRGQVASARPNGLGPLPPYGGIGKNWYKLAYMRRFVNSQCLGGTVLSSSFYTRPGMNPETCSMLATQTLASFWQVPFDGDTERVVGYQFTTTRQMLPVAKGAKSAGTLQTPTFSFAQAKGTTTGLGSDNCITVSLIPSVTLVSGSSQTQITIGGLLNSGTSDSDTLALYSDKDCSSLFSALVGSDGAATRQARPVAGTSANAISIADSLIQTYRPFGRAAIATGGLARIRTITDGTTSGTAAAYPNTGGYGSDGYHDDADWHTRSRTGTISALTTGDPNNNVVTASTLAGVTSLTSGKLTSPVGTLATGNGNAQFQKTPGTLTVNLAPGYFLQAGELLVFSFKIQNANAVQVEQTLKASASGIYCDSDNGFCDGTNDKSLSIVNVPMVSKGKLLQSALPKFVTAIMYQSSSDPDSLATLFVTLRMNVALNRPDATASAIVTISGLCGFETGTDIKLYQNQKAGGIPKDSSYPIEAVRTMSDMPGLTSDDATIVSSAVTFEAGALEITLGTAGFAAETDYSFAFQMQTSKVATAACTPQISSSGGTFVVISHAMTATNVGLVLAPQFTTLKIGQVTTRPGVTNYLCVTLQHNFQFYTDSVVNQVQGATGNYVSSKITISGLTGTQAVDSAVVPLSYCPTQLGHFDDKTTQYTSTQFQPDVTDFNPNRYATFGTKACFGETPQKCVPGNPYVPSSAFDTAVAGRSWFGGQSLDSKDSFTWDQATGTAVLTVDADITRLKVTEPQTVKGGIPKNAEIVFALPLQNGVAASGCKVVTFEASGQIVQKATMVQSQTGRALQDGEAVGDACALKVYPPGFHVRQITQSTSATEETNVITVSLRSNVDFSSVANGQASYITISGLTGTATGSDDLGVSATPWRFSPKFENTKGVWVQGPGTITMKIGAGACVPPTVWSSGAYYDGTSTKTAPFSLGGSFVSGTSPTTSTGNTILVDEQPGYLTGGKLATTMPSVCMKAGYLYVFSFQVTNPSTEQVAPAVSIQGNYRNTDNIGIPIAKVAMQAPISDDADKKAMLVSNQILTTYKIGQLIPAPGSINVICVTLTTSKDIQSLSDASLSSITFTGLTGFDASAQDLQLYENDGVTKISSTGGDPSSDNYNVGAIFSSQNTASGSSTTTSGPGWANYDGASAGNVVVWIQGTTVVSSVYSYMQKNVDHKFCFRLKNPKTEMACKDVSVVVNNQGTISRIKAEQDMSNTVENYKFASTCAGYVAPPNFIIKNWRSSSNTTEATAIIHMELATNLLLETGDTITVSGLTSYAKACPTPPCDVGIDVTRTAVAMLHGKPHINGVRNVKGYGATDSGASAAARQTFAKAIQSYDLSGTASNGLTSTFGTTASWGKLGDTQDSASTLIFTVAKTAVMSPANIANTISNMNAPSEADHYEIVFTLKNRATVAATAPIISINIGQGQTQYVSLPMNAGQTAAATAITRAGDGGMDITYTPQKAIYGGESLILTLPKFTRDSNGMIFGITSSPNSAFKTYSSWQDWKAYGTDQRYARAFFTNGWYADGFTAKSGDSGQTGERWNYPNVNAKATTDADYNHDTGVLVLDINDPGVGMNKNYWYAATEDNLYEGRVTRAANTGALQTEYYTAASPLVSLNLPASAADHATPVNMATVDYYLDNGEDLLPVRAFTKTNEVDFSSSLLTNNFQRTVAYMPVTSSSTSPTTAYIKYFDSVNIVPSPIPTTVASLADNIAGTPPFTGIPSKFQPSRRDNFYKGMLMKCWVGTKAIGGRLPYVETLATGADNYLIASTTQKELLPPPEYVPITAYGKVLTSAIADVNLDITATTPDAVTQGTMSTTLVTDAVVFAKAGVSRTLETRVIQASYRQIDYVPRKGGGCFVTGGVVSRAQIAGISPAAATATTVTLASTTAATVYETTIALTAASAAGTTMEVGQQVIMPDGSVRTITTYTSTASIGVDGPPYGVGGIASTTTAVMFILGLERVDLADSGAVGCQDEVPGYPAVVRLESPFSRPLDPDALCYIQRKADVGVYTGMTAMVGDLEYSIKQGAANIYTVGFAADAMTGPNGDPVDRKVPRTYSTEGSGFSTAGLRTTPFFSDGVGLSGQPYTIYSQLELVAKAGSKVSVGESFTISLPNAVGIFPPVSLEAKVTPANYEDTIADKVKISHVLLVPLSPACSIVAGYGVASGCQDGNGKGGVFDLILSDKWPYAYSTDNKNDLNGYAMTVFGGQATVIKTMADKYSQDLPYRPLEGLNTNVAAAGQAIYTSASVLNANAVTTESVVTDATFGGRGQTDPTTSLPLANTATLITAADAGPFNANSQIETSFTVARELDLLTLTGGSLRADAMKTPKLPNAPIALTYSACGSRQTDTLGASTLPYAVCLSLGDGVLAHSQRLTAGDSVITAMNTLLTTGYTTAAFAAPGATTPLSIFKQAPTKLALTVKTGLRVGQQIIINYPAAAAGFMAVVEVVAITSLTSISVYQVHPAAAKTLTDAAHTLIVVPWGAQMDAEGIVKTGVQKITGEVGQEASPVYPHPMRLNRRQTGSARPVPDYGTVQGKYEDPADNLGLGAFLIVGVYTSGTSDRFVHAQQANKGTTLSAFPVDTDMQNNLVIQRYIGTSRSPIPLADVPSGYIGGNNLNKPTGGFPAPAGQVPRYQARLAAGYAIGRFSYGVDNIMQVRSDMTSGAPATGNVFSMDVTTMAITTKVTPLLSGIPGNNNMDGAIPMSPGSKSADVSTFTTTAADTTIAAVTAAAIAVVTTNTAITAGSYYHVEATGEIFRAESATAVVRGAMGTRSFPIPATTNIDLVTASTTILGAPDFLSTAVTPFAETSTGIVNKHPSGHSVDTTSPTTMQKIRFGRATLPLPQVLHTAAHRAGTIAQTNFLTRGTCGLLGANAVSATGPPALSVMPIKMTAISPTASLEMCMQVSSAGFNVDLPFSRNAYIEKGMDVFLVSSIFDTLIQRPEPIRKVATGLTEEGRSQNFPGSGHFVGGPVTVELLIAPVTAVALTLITTEITIATGTIGSILKVGDIIHLTVAGTAVTATAEAVMNTEAMLITKIVDVTLTVQRGYLGTVPITKTTAALIWVRRTNGAFPGIARNAISGAAVFSSSAAPSAVSPLPLMRTVGVGTHSSSGTSADTRFQRHNQLLGNLQTTGLRMPRGGPSTSTGTATAIDSATISVTTGGVVTTPSIANAKGMHLDTVISTESYNYGFDSDIRLYSVLGPFTRPAVIRDVVDTAKTAYSRSVQTSRFPGVVSIHDMMDWREWTNTGMVATTADAITLTTITVGVVAEDVSAWGALMVGDYIARVPISTGPLVPETAYLSAEDDYNYAVTPKRHREIMQVTSVLSGVSINVVRGALGTTAVLGVATDVFYKLPVEKRGNNVRYSLAPIKGTTFATAQTRATQYNTYSTEGDRIISFCNGLQSDLNNAPGAVIMSAISDDPLTTYGTAVDIATAATALILAAGRTFHPLAGKEVYVNPLLLAAYSSTLVAAAVADTSGVAVTVGAATAGLINNGDYFKIGVDGTEIFRLVSGAASTAFVVERAMFGTTAVANAATTLVLYVIPRSEISRLITQSQAGDNLFASSNGKASTAPSMWTVPRRHHLCRKLVTGAPELANPDVIADLYRVANFVANVGGLAGVATMTENNDNDQYARSRYTESMQMSTVLNQDPSPNMRAMVTFVQPTKISVNFDSTPVCSVPVSSFDAAKVDSRCATFTIVGETSSVVLPGGALPSWFTLSHEEIPYASFPEFQDVTLRRATVDELLKSGIAIGDQKLGLNVYNKGMCLGNFIKITVPARNTDPNEGSAVLFQIKQTAIREGTLTDINTGLNNGRRRLLATCPDGFDARLISVGTALSTACKCEKACGVAQATCSTKSGGTWNTVNLLERVCRDTATPSPYDATGAIVGGVLGGFFGLLLIGLLVWYLCCRKPVSEPVGRAVAMVDKPLAPVYLPQPYPSLPEQYMPAPMPAYPAEMVQPTGQPMLYSSYQGPPPGMEAYPSQPGAYTAPYGVVPQPASYGMIPQQQMDPYGVVPQMMPQQQQPGMYVSQQQPMYGQPPYGI